MGAAGLRGISACFIETMLENALNPNAFLA
jgi:hypothetical protein